MKKSIAVLGLGRFGQFLTEELCKNGADVLIADAAESLEILPLEQDLDILRNVVYSGVWQRYCLLTERKNRKEESYGK